MAAYLATPQLVPTPTWLVGDREVTFHKRRVIMGILNVTPDSFSDGGEFFQTEAAVEHGLRMVQEGADIIDVGGESTRPGADPVTPEEELSRVIPVIDRLSRQTPALLSVDTSKAVVAAAALRAGAQIVNDISGLGFDPDMAATVAEHRASLVLMHIRGTPRTMESKACYEDVVGEVMDYFTRRLAKAQEEGIDLRRVALDPGIGFGKDTVHNYTLLRDLGRLSALGRPVVLGTSRKRMIGEALGGRDPRHRVWGTAATVACGLFTGAHVVRVHDVMEMADVVRVTEMLVQPPPSSPSSSCTEAESTCD